MSLKSVAGRDGLEEGHAIAEEILFLKLLRENDLGRNENGGLAGAVRRSDFNQRLLVIPCASLKPQSAAGDVLALHKFILAVWMPDQGDVIDSDARILAAIRLPNIGCVRGRGNGEDGSGSSGRQLYGQRSSRGRLRLGKSR